MQRLFAKVLRFRFLASTDNRNPMRPPIGTSLHEATTKLYRYPSALQAPGLGPVKVKHVIGSDLTMPGGLYYFPNAISPDECRHIMDIIDGGRGLWVGGKGESAKEAGVEGGIRRRLQFYGDVYYHTTHNLKTLQPAAAPQSSADHTNNKSLPCTSDILPPQARLERPNNDTSELQAEPPSTPSSPLSHFQSLMSKLDSLTKSLYTLPYPPTQILVNEYVGMQGLSCHLEDTNAFGPYIYTVSLLNPIWMDLKPILKGSEDQRTPIRVLLEPGSVLLMCEEVRYGWMHGITKGRQVVWEEDSEGSPGEPEGALHGHFEGGNHSDGDVLENGRKVHIVKRGSNFRRLSLTIRTVEDGRKRVLADNYDWA